MQQPNYPAPGQKDPITIVDYPAPRQKDDQKPSKSYDQPSPNIPQQNYQYQPQPQMGQPQLQMGQPQPYRYQHPQMSQYQDYQQPQMGPSMLMPMPPQQYYQQQKQAQFYQQPVQVQPMPRQEVPGAAPPIGVQGAYPMATQTVQPWTTGLFDCGDDIENTIITCCCPCITFGQIAEITDRGVTSCCFAGFTYAMIANCSGLQFIFSMVYRTRLRQQYSLPEEPFHDCIVHWCCETCALCQEYRELKNRGFNMQLGWAENMQLQAQMAEAQQRVAPPVQGMTR